MDMLAKPELTLPRGSSTSPQGPPKFLLTRGVALALNTLGCGAYGIEEMNSVVGSASPKALGWSCLRPRPTPQPDVWAEELRKLYEKQDGQPGVPKKHVRQCR